MLIMAKEIRSALVCMGRDDTDDKRNMLVIVCSAWGVRDTEPPDFSWASPILIFHAEADDAAGDLIMMTMGMMSVVAVVIMIMIMMMGRMILKM